MERNNKDVNELLVDELKSEIERLKNLTPGTKEHSEAVDAVVKLYEANIKTVESKREGLAKYLRIGVDAGGVVLPLAVYWILTMRGYKFEETGVIGSSTLRNLIGKFKPH